MNQAQFLRRLSGRERLEQALSLSDFVRELSLRDIRKKKNVSREGAINELRRRLKLANHY